MEQDHDYRISKIEHDNVERDNIVKAMFDMIGELTVSAAMQKIQNNKANDDIAQIKADIHQIKIDGHQTRIDLHETKIIVEKLHQKLDDNLALLRQDNANHENRIVWLEENLWKMYN